MAITNRVETSNTASGGDLTTGSITITSGRRLIAVAAYFNASQQTITVSDSLGNTWNAVGSQFYDATNDEGCQFFEATVANAGSATFTMNAGTSAFRAIAVIEDDAAVGAVDVADGGWNMQSNPGTGTDAITSDVLATTNGASARIFGFTFEYNTNGIPSAGTGFTHETNGVWGGLGAVCGRWESRDATLDNSDAATFTYGGAGTPLWFTGIVVILTAAPATVEQEGFRFGLDDGSESAHSFTGAQDANETAPLDSVRTLRLLLNATDDPATAAYTLRVQKNGAGGYTAVPVGATSVTPPVIEAADATVTTIGTASDPWAINRPTGSTGDLMVFVLAWDDSVTVSSVAAPAGPNSETANSIVGPIASASTEMRMQAWYYVATGTWSSGTLSFDPSAAETVRAVAFRVPAGEFDSTTPIGASSSSASAGTTESNINSPAFSAGSTDGGGRLVLCFGSDADAITVPANDTDTVNNATGGGVGLDIETRTAAVTNSESIASITATIASDSWACLAFIVRGVSVTNEMYVSTSANVAAGGEATTARLTAPSGKTTGDFDTGRRWDDENGADSIDITADNYTEVEWVLTVQSPAQNADFYDFRVYAGGSAIDTYTLTPRWTVGTATVAVLPIFGTRPFIPLRM